MDNSLSIKNIKSESVSSQVLEELKRYIISQGMTTGDQLPSEPQLATLLGTSRSSIREAMKVLEGRGFIKTIHGKGRFIADFNYSSMLDSLSYNLHVHFRDFMEIVEVRKALEAYFLPQAALLCTEKDYADLQRILSRLKYALDKKIPEKKLVEIHAQFHRRLYKPIDNKLLESLINLFATFQKQLSDLHRKDEQSEGFLERHQALLDSVKSKNRQRILDCFGNHFADFDIGSDHSL